MIRLCIGKLAPLNHSVLGFYAKFCLHRVLRTGVWFATRSSWRWFTSSSDTNLCTDHWSLRTCWSSNCPFSPIDEFRPNLLLKVGNNCFSLNYANFRLSEPFDHFKSIELFSPNSNSECFSFRHQVHLSLTLFPLREKINWMYMCFCHLTLFPSEYNIRLRTDGATSPSDIRLIFASPIRSSSSFRLDLNMNFMDYYFEVGHCPLLLQVFTQSLKRCWQTATQLFLLIPAPVVDWMILSPPHLSPRPPRLLLQRQTGPRRFDHAS